MSKGKWLAGIVGAVGVAVWIAVLLGTRKPDQDDDDPSRNIERVAKGAPPSAPPAPTRSQPHAGVDIRQQVREAVDQSSGSVSLATLPRYLDGLLARARAQGRVTALESEVGMEMIVRVGGDIETQLAFSSKLNELAQELRGETATPPPSRGEARGDLARIADQLGRETDRDKRQALVEQFVAKASALDPGEAAEAMSRLNALVAPAAPAPPTAADIAARWAAVEEARGAARQAAIHRLMETVSSLPPDEQIDHVQRLNRLAAAEGPAR